MATAYKTLGNANPGASLTVLYTCPSGYDAVAKFVACNRSTSPRTFRMAVSPAGAAIADDHYWYYDVEIPPNDTIEIDGIGLDQTDVVRVYGQDDQVSFNLNGVELN